MPELPEVETIVRGLQKEVLKRTFVDFWTDTKKIIKKPKNVNRFKKEIKGKKIERVSRRGKNILFFLSKNKVLLIHQKMTGHLLLGKWKLKGGKWESQIKGPLLDDPMNKFLHLVLWLNDKRMLALSDLRKFAKVELWDKDELESSQTMQKLGPEPLESNFTFAKFKSCLKKGKIKQVLLDQNVIAGIGNIYADEILFDAKIHPLRETTKLKDKELKRIYKAIKRILPLAIKLKGASISDYRTLYGKKGKFDLARKVYRKEGKKCFRCKALIKRIKLGGRSAHFCPKCQSL